MMVLLNNLPKPDHDEIVVIKKLNLEFRVRIYQQPMAVIVTELNKGRMVTQAWGDGLALVLAQKFSLDPDKVVWVEHWYDASIYFNIEPNLIPELFKWVLPCLKAPFGVTQSQPLEPKFFIAFLEGSP